MVKILLTIILKTIYLTIEKDLSWTKGFILNEMKNNSSFMQSFKQTEYQEEDDPPSLGGLSNLSGFKKEEPMQEAGSFFYCR